MTSSSPKASVTSFDHFIKGSIGVGLMMNCFALEFLDSELSVFMQRLRVQGAAGELGRA